MRQHRSRMGNPGGLSWPPTSSRGRRLGKEAPSQRAPVWLWPARPHRAGREEVRHGGGSRWGITCATPVTNSGTPSDVSIFSQRHRMVITSRDSLRSSQRAGGRGGNGEEGHSKHTQLPDQHGGFMPAVRWVRSVLGTPLTASLARAGGVQRPPPAATSGSLLEPPNPFQEWTREEPFRSPGRDLSPPLSSSWRVLAESGSQLSTLPARAS